MVKKRVLLLLAEGFEFFEASVFIDVMGWNLLEGDQSTELRTCGLTREVKSSFSQRILVDLVVDEVDVSQFDALAIPGGFEEFNFYEEAYSEKFLKIIRRFDAQGKTIATICTGALPVGKSGVLEGRFGTTYRKNQLRQDQLKSFGVQLTEGRIVVDRNIVTSHDPSTAIEVAYVLLQMLTSEENTKHVKSLMGFS